MVVKHTIKHSAVLRLVYGYARDTLKTTITTF